VGRGSIQGDAAFADVLERMGARIDRGDNWIEARSGSTLAGIEIDCTPIPDAAMTLAVVALFAQGPTTLTGIASWRVKETDRIAAMATELRKLGARVDAATDRLTVFPPSRFVPATIATYDDHRMAMCFSLAALSGVAVRILDPTAWPRRIPAISRRSIRWRSDERATDVPVITVDGPAASGKGTIATGVAKALAFHQLDSGSLYRVVALAALDAGIGSEDSPALAAIAQDLDVTFADGRIALAGRDVTDRIRQEDMSAAASRVAVHPAVRTALLGRQRAFRRPPGLVADGRDMGTVVFPDATLKVFLTASQQERAERRYKQLIEKGISSTLESLLRDIRERDARDAGRVVAPLAAAADAVTLDTTGMTIAAAIHFVLDRYRALRPGGNRQLRQLSEEGAGKHLQHGFTHGPFLGALAGVR
jgi:3-phosphoshikimate 1-carboxyvinyltransferase